MKLESCALLVRMQNGIAAVKNSLMIPEKVKIRITIWFSNFTSRYIPLRDPPVAPLTQHFFVCLSVFLSTLSPESCCFHFLNVFLSVSSLFQLRPYHGECGHLTCLPVSWPHSTSTHPPHTNWKISILCIKLFTAFWRIKGYYQKKWKGNSQNEGKYL